ncbi:MAG TPA: hypothetical protein VFT05_13900 [Burkholderiaceae bacterium]|jgi:hypothetical protein|nr:hypothetical protein [Burkholderiaceae bacterium]
MKKQDLWRDRLRRPHGPVSAVRASGRLRFSSAGFAETIAGTTIVDF